MRIAQLVNNRYVHSAQYKASSGKGAPTISFFQLDIDIQRNEPNIYKEHQRPNPEGWHGAEVSVTIAGNWQYYRAKILRYLRQIAVITPYAEVRCGLSLQVVCHAASTV